MTDAAVPHNQLRGAVRALLVAEVSPLKSMEWLVIDEAMSMMRGNKVQTAKLLGISRNCLYDKIAAYGLHDDHRNRTA